MAYPLIFDSDAVTFTTQGNGALSDAISCVVEENLNGSYELEMKYPANGLHAEYIIPNNLIVCQANLNSLRQAFRIYDVTQEINGIATIRARHISYDLNGYPAEPFTANTLASAVSGLLSSVSSIIDNNPFSITADFASSASFSVDVPSPVRSWFGGREGSLIDVYGGEWEYDNFDCYLRQKRGEDNNVRVQYGKNLTKYSKKINSESLCSHICAFWQDTETGTLVKSSYVPTGITEISRVKYIDVSADYLEAPTAADLTTFAQGKISEYNALALNVAAAVIPMNDIQDLIELGDTVHVYYGDDIFTTRCVTVVWNVLKEVYDSISVGALKTSLAATINNSVGQDGYTTKKDVASMIQKASAVKVVEKGTSNGWTYKKYTDGTYEALKSITVSATATSTAWGSLYRTAGFRFGDLPSLDNGQGFSINVSYLVDTSITNITAAGWPVCFYSPGASSDPCETGVWVIVTVSSSNSMKGTLTAQIHGKWTS